MLNDLGLAFNFVPSNEGAAKSGIILNIMFFILFICSFVLAGTDILHPPSKSIVVNFKESIESADISKLTTLINENSKVLASSSSEKYRYECFRIAVEKGSGLVFEET